jgi:hypothetical protein
MEGPVLRSSSYVKQIWDFFHFLEIVTSWLVPSAGQQIPAWVPYSALRFFKSPPSLFPMIPDGHPPGITRNFLIKKPVTIFTPCDATQEWVFPEFLPTLSFIKGGALFW